MKTEISNRPGLSLISKIRSKNKTCSDIMNDLDVYINLYTDKDEMRTNNIFQLFAAGNDEFTKVIDSLNENEKEIVKRYNQLILQEKLLDANKKISETKVNFLNSVRDNFPKEIQDLKYLTEKERIYLQKLKMNEDTLSMNIQSMKEMYGKTLSLYKTISQLSFNRINSSHIEINISSISKLNPGLTLSLIIEIKDTLRVESWKPRELDLDKYIVNLIEPNYDLSLFLCDVIGEAINKFN